MASNFSHGSFQQYEHLFDQGGVVRLQSLQGRGVGILRHAPQNTLDLQGAIQ